MSNYRTNVISSSDIAVKNKVLKNTYLLLGMSLAFSGFVGGDR